ncbi:uncharacterized protein LOC143288914 [Babylonia areolata]|uniref:uncharacterized protein LOC143288914 n=1 Tax=Babylonia areolata TaxID=304850 RepID=UPI003FD2297F
MQSVCRLLLALSCVLGVASVLGVPAERQTPWRLEQGVAPAPLVRSRRQALPGSGMPCLTVSFLTDLKRRFEERIDPDTDGKATENEVRHYLSHFNPALSDMQVQRFITRRDLNGNGQIDFIPEYVLDIATPDMTAEAAEEWFSLEDRDHDGFVSRQELQTIAQLLGMSPQQAKIGVSSYYMSVDKDGDDRLSFDEYKELYGQ